MDKIKKEIPDIDSTDEVIFEDTESESSITQKLRKRLKACEKEKHEYLDGWQRLKAENVNTKKRDKEHEQRALIRAQEALLEELIPILDSFDMAFRGDAWNAVDEVWRIGVEQIHAQLITIIQSRGYTAYGEVGDTFDPQFYEAVASIDGGESGTIARIERTGYKNDTAVLRAAQVTIYK